VESLETEQDQVEAIVRWWKEYGRAIIVGLVLGFAILFGWRTWQGQQKEQAVLASQLYESIMIDMQNNKFDRIKATSKKITSEHEGTPYAFFAALILARLEVTEGNYAAAEQQLRWALAHLPGASMADLVHTRLARVLLAQEKYPEALQYADGKGYIHAGLRGDILLAQGNKEEARKAYQEALGDPAISPEIQAMLKIKLGEIGG
jgi:predicted negative regulator of RcsB-dependent stress response